ncbi:hypothetical protein V6N13_016866 [Hibiscus sabdariffa]
MVSWNKEQVQKGIQQVVTLFVHNLPNRLHWKGLWHVFARHGDVIDALRAMERLNGLVIYGNKILVALAKYSGRMQPKKRIVVGMSREDVHKDLGQRKSTIKESIFRNAEKAPMEGEIGDPGKQRVKKFKRLLGHVEVEDLWKMKRCLVGVMATVCNVSSISSRLYAWSLREIEVQRMGGKRFLLLFEDDELFTMLEDLQW